MTALAIEMIGVTKRFGNILANDAIDFVVNKGEIHALVGENGAGKTTLMNILYGLYHPDSGQILINGTEKDILSPADAIKNGIGMVHQHFMLVGRLSVLENIILGDEDTKWGVVNYTAAKTRLEQIVKKFKLNINLKAKVETLPVGTQQKIEILKILYRNSDIIIFDEPTAVLTPQEADELFVLLKNLKQDGKSIILITHKLGEVLSVSDRVTVLRHGKVIGVKNTTETNRHELAEMIVGGNMPEAGRKMKQPDETIVLSVKELFVEREKTEDAVMGVSFEIHSAEIFGIAGVEGNGQAELVEAINGLRSIKSGEIKIIGGENIAHIPANRNKNGIVNEYAVCENILLGRQHEKKFSNGWLIKKRHLTAYTSQLISDYDIRPGDALQQTDSLSGGNQQKLVAARELTKNSKLIIASHPTRGLDIKAAEFVHNILIEQRNKGKGVLLVSADLGELLKLSDRIGVMFNGKIIIIVDAAKTNERELGLYMTGAAEES